MKYKLIKLLPFENSPKIGYISEPHCTQKDGAHYWNHNWFNPENYPEFWEEVIEKVKIPLFTTEDGVNIFKDDTFYYVKFTQYNMTVGKPFEIVRGDYLSFEYEPQYEKYFSTKEKAEEYILLNKPCLSYGDVQEYLKVKDCNKVLDLAQSKIQQSV